MSYTKEVHCTKCAGNGVTRYGHCEHCNGRGYLVIDTVFLCQACGKHEASHLVLRTCRSVCDYCAQSEKIV